MGSQEDSQLHFILVPMMAQGHMIPMMDMARLIADRGVVVTVITTPLNASRFKTVINRAVESGLPIRIVELRFPCQEAGLPEGCENLDTLPSMEMATTFLDSLQMLQQPLEDILRQQQPLPSCIISDMCFPWTCEIARKFQIPRLLFHGMNCFSLLCSHNLRRYKVHESVTSDLEPFLVPELPHRIEVTKAQLPGTVESSGLDDFHKRIREAELTSYGVVVNSYEELEPEYIENYRKATGKKVWAIGPVSLCNKEALDKVERGNKASIGDDRCLSWLDSWNPNSVIYASFGSLCRFSPLQMIEIGLGLEASNHPFIWVIKGCNNLSELEKWLSDEKFEERIERRGLLIRGWAPQILILSHPATGGFLTHCGWNSMLEGLCAGVPMITWPIFGEQFFNEKFLVHVLGIGVRVGVEIRVRFGCEEKVGVLVKKDNVKKVVVRLMDGDEVTEMRRKGREIGDMAKKAMEESGSSYLNMTLLIQDIMQHASDRLAQTKRVEESVA